jgi:ribonuclease R
MREHLGEEYSGVVSSATTFGLFVTLDAMYVEGLVHITELGGEYFRFDEARQELRGERTGIRYAIGTRVRIQVSRVDLDGRKIDFRLVQEGQSLQPRAVPDKTVPRDAKGRPEFADRVESDGGAFKGKARQRTSAKAPRSARANEKTSSPSKKTAKKQRR